LEAWREIFTGPQEVRSETQQFQSPSDSNLPATKQFGGVS